MKRIRFALCAALAPYFLPGCIMAHELDCVFPQDADAAAHFVCAAVRAQLATDMRQPLELIFLTARANDLSAHLRRGSQNGPQLGLHAMDGAVLTQDKLRTFATALLNSLP